MTTKPALQQILRGTHRVEKGRNKTKKTKINKDWKGPENTTETPTPHNGTKFISFSTHSKCQWTKMLQSKDIGYQNE